MAIKELELIDGTFMSKEVCEKRWKEIYLLYTQAGGIETLRMVYNENYSPVMPYHAQLMDWGWIEIDYIPMPQIEYIPKFKGLNADVVRLVKLCFNPTTKELKNPVKPNLE